MKETTLWKQIRTTGILHYATRIENRVGHGIPDVWWMQNNGLFGWLELKSLRFDTSRDVLRPAQSLWMRDAAKHNVPAYVVWYAIDAAEYGLFRGADLAYQTASEFVFFDTALLVSNDVRNVLATMIERAATPF